MSASTSATFWAVGAAVEYVRLVRSSPYDTVLTRAGHLDDPAM